MTPWGVPAYRSKSAVQVSERRYRYHGKERDEETGFGYHGKRYLAHWLGRWTTADPLGAVDGVNLYRFGRNNPVRFKDPNGTFSFEGLGKAFQRAAGGEDYAQKRAQVLNQVGDGAPQTLAFEKAAERESPERNPDIGSTEYIADALNEYASANAAVAATLVAGSTPMGQFGLAAAGVQDALEQSDQGKADGFAEVAGKLYGTVNPGYQAGGEIRKGFAGFDVGDPKSVGRAAAGLATAVGTIVLATAGSGKGKPNAPGAATGSQSPTKVAGPSTALPDFVVGPDGTAVPVSQSRLRAGLRAAGFPETPTRSPGVQHTLPDGSTVRTMEPAGPAPRRASFENKHGHPIDPFTGKPPQPPSGLSRGERKQYVRERTHLEQKK